MIRKRKPALDDGAIVRLIREELIPLNPPELRDQSVSHRALLKRIGRGATYVWAASAGLRASGFITMVQQGDAMLIDLLAMDPRHRGKGIGTSLLKKAERRAWALGCSSLQLYVNDDNYAGIHFYERNGFHRMWHEPRLRCFIMQKVIQEGAYVR